MNSPKTWNSGDLLISHSNFQSSRLTELSFSEAQNWIQKNGKPGDTFMYFPYPTTLEKE